MSKDSRIPSAMLLCATVLLGMNVAGMWLRPAQATTTQSLGAAPGVPVPVGISTTQVVVDNGSGVRTWRVFRQWSDWSVDHALVRFKNTESCDVIFSCAPSQVMASTDCAADLTHDGIVGLEDLTLTLNQFGPCP